MKLDNIDFGFVEIIENAIVEKIICKYNGSCTVYFYDKPPKEISIICSSYNSQYGIPVSEDGTRLFVGSWENGLCAYDINSGEILWRFKSGRIRNIIVYSTFLIVTRANSSVVKIDVATGKPLASIRSGTLERIFRLDSSYIFADTISGKYCIIDVENMVVVKKYVSAIVNPFACLSLIITNAIIQHGTLMIFGIESYPQKTYTAKTEVVGKPFQRVIDPHFQF